MFPDNLDLIPHDSYSLYLHVPFCTVRCGYCNFFSVANADSGVVEKTVEQSIRDIEFAVSILADENRPQAIETVYIGGGTPSVVPPGLLRRFLDTVSTILPSRSDEFTVEVNPESLNEEHVALFESAGVTRVSVGIQSLDPVVLRYLERRATSDVNLEALELLRAGFSGDVNVDLICGVPGQKPGNIERDVAVLLGFEPDHVSLYSLTVEENTPLSRAIRNGKADPPDPDLQTDLWSEGIGALEESGFTWYEISNFARPGGESLHNLRYWRMLPYLGIGPSAASTLAGRGGPLRIRADNSVPNPRYASTRLTPNEFLLEHLMMGLRTNEGVSRTHLETVFGVDPFLQGASAIEPFFEDGVLLSEGDRIVASRAGRMILDSVIASIAVGVESCRIGSCRWPAPKGRE